MIVQYCATCIAEMLHNTKHRDSSVNIPLSPDQHHCSGEAKWRIGGALRIQSTLHVLTLTKINQSHQHSCNSSSFAADKMSSHSRVQLFCLTSVF